MVRGVEKFKEYFRDYTGQYTFIGGTACDIILGNLGEEFRATKDLDMVLILEELMEDMSILIKELEKISFLDLRNLKIKHFHI